jgi:sarcosine oxidase
MGKSYDAIVLGLGAMGSATAYTLAKSGLRVLGIEQFGVPHDRGSYTGGTRAIRLAYYEHPDYVPLLRRSYELWRGFEQEVNQELLHVTGGLYIGKSNGSLVAGSHGSATRHNLPHRLLTNEEILREFPQFSLPEDFVGFYEPNAGYLLSDGAVSAYVRRSLELGADIRCMEPVVDWKAYTSHVSVTTSRDTYEAAQLVVCAGPWTQRLLKDLGVPLVVTRQATAWMWPVAPERFRSDHFPVWALEYDRSSLLYGFPLGDVPAGVKVARHAAGPIVDPDTMDRAPTAEDERDIRGALARYLPDANGTLTALRLCLYTYSPDCHFIIDRHPSYPSVQFCCGFSGHGFKFAGVVGEILRDLVVHGHTSLPADLFRLSRFSR